MAGSEIQRAFDLLPEEKQDILLATIVLRDALADGDLPAFLTFAATVDGVSVSAGTVAYGVVRWSPVDPRWRAETEGHAPSICYQRAIEAVHHLLGAWGLAEEAS